MKNRLGLIVLGVICVGLLIATIVTKKQASDRQQQDAEAITTLTNKLSQTTSDLLDQRQVTSLLEKDLDTQRKANVDLTNNFTQVTENLAKSETSLKATREEVKQRDSKIADLESQNQSLDKQAAELSATITNLTSEIAETRRKLAATQGDKTLLEQQLKGLLAEKEELEHQFNDLTVLKAQVSRLKEEIVIARRREWTRDGVYARANLKGGQLIMQGAGSVQQAPGPQPQPNYDLNVEVNSDGSVRVLPSNTNSPAASPQKK